MELEIRNARQDDGGPIAELMYSSGMDLYDYLYKQKTLDFLRYEFRSGKGFAGHPNVTVALLDGEVVGTGCFYGRDNYETLVNDSMKNMLGYFGPIKIIPVAMRARHIGSVIRTPKPGELYLSNFGVADHVRSQGIGSKMIRFKLEQARKSGYTLFGLDVSSANPRGQALYSRLGLRVQKEKAFSAKNSGVKPARKMELTL